MRLRVYTSISRVCCVICMIVRARSRPEMEVRDSWNDLEVHRFSLFSFRMGRPIFFLFFFTFYLASLAFRPIPTCFRTPIQSLIVHTHSLILSFSLSTLFLSQPSRYIQRGRELRCGLLELSRESRQERVEYTSYSYAREGRRSVSC